MKKIYNYLWVLACVLLFVGANGNLLAQTFRTACPYNVASWPYPNSNDWMGCPPALQLGNGGRPCPSNYTQKPYQDCCGAIPLYNNYITFGRQSTNTRFNSTICGQGCSQGDLPPIGTACFGGIEKQTTWFIFEIKALIGGSDTIGAPAGKLRFKIFPCDSPPNYPSCEETSFSSACNCDTVNPLSPILCNDNGRDNMGSLDFDWIVFRINNSNSTRSACNSVSAGTSTVACCNWSSLRGPTGMFEQPNGAGISCDVGALGGRFSSPLSVSVGDRFILAVDAFVNQNLKSYKIDFRGECANLGRDGLTASVGAIEYPNERIPTSQFQQLLSRTDSCVIDSISFRFTQPQRNSTMSVSNYKLFRFNDNGSSDSNFVINEVLPINDAITATDWKINFDFLGLTRGNYALRFMDTVNTYFQTKVVADTLYFKVGGGIPPAIRIAQPFNACLLQPTTLTVSDTTGYSFLWSTGETTPSITVEEPSQYSVAATYNGACRQTTTASIFLRQPSLRNCPITISLSARPDNLTASLPALSYQWEHNGILMNRFTRSIPITLGGYYRVRAINGNDTSNWSPVVIIMSNQLTLKSGGLQVYPNPSKGIVNIQVPAGFQTIELSDKLGKVLLTKPIQSATTINIQGYPKGVYTIRAKGGQVISTQLVVE